MKEDKRSFQSMLARLNELSATAKHFPTNSRRQERKRKHMMHLLLKRAHHLKGE